MSGVVHSDGDTNYVTVEHSNVLLHCCCYGCCLLSPDYALGMELKKRGFQATYLMEYLAEGEVRCGVGG